MYMSTPSVDLKTSTLTPLNKPQPHFLITIIRLCQKNLIVLALISFILLGWSGVYLTFLYTPAYESISRLIVKDTALTRQYIEPEKHYQVQTTTSSNSNPIINSMELFYSNDVANGLYFFLKKQHPDTLKKKAISNLTEWRKFYKHGEAFIKLKNKTGTDIITTSFVWDDPVVAQQALGEVVRLVQHESLKINLAEHTQRLGFLQEKINGINKSLQAVRQKKGQFKNSLSSPDLVQRSSQLAETKGSLENKLFDLESQIKGMQSEQAKYQALLGMDAKSAMTASSLGRNTNISALQTQLYELRAEYAKLSSLYTDKYPEVKKLKSQIQQIEANIRQETTSVLGRKSGSRNIKMLKDDTQAEMTKRLVEISTTLPSLQSQLASLKGDLGSVNSQMRSIPGNEIKMANLDSEELLLSSSLSALQSRLLESKLKEAQSISNLFVIDTPDQADEANFPKPIHVIFLTVVASLGLWAAWLLFAYRFGSIAGFFKALSATEEPSKAPEEEAYARLNAEVRASAVSEASPSYNIH